MKRKGPRAIPDFSSKRPAAPHGTPDPKFKTQPPPVPRAPLVKPRATSSKSGQRGT